MSINEKPELRESVFLTEGDDNNSAFYAVSPEEIASIASDLHLAADVLNMPGGPPINEEDPYLDSRHQSSGRYTQPTTDRRKELDHRFKQILNSKKQIKEQREQRLKLAEEKHRVEVEKARRLLLEEKNKEEEARELWRLQVSNKIRLSKAKQASMERYRPNERSITTSVDERTELSNSRKLPKADSRLYKKMEAAAKLKEDEIQKEKELRLMQIKIDHQPLDKLEL